MFRASSVAPRDDVEANRCNNHAGARGAVLRAADTVVPADRVFSAAEAKGGSAIDASKTALLLVEYQNEFTTEGGKLHDAVKESMAATGMLERSAKLADEARNKGVTIIHAPITFKEDASDNPNKRGPALTLPTITPSTRFMRKNNRIFTQGPRHPRRLRGRPIIHRRNLERGLP